MQSNGKEMIFANFLITFSQHFLPFYLIVLGISHLCRKIFSHYPATPYNGILRAIIYTYIYYIRACDIHKIYIIFALWRVYADKP